VARTEGDTPPNTSGVIIVYRPALFLGFRVPGSHSSGFGSRARTCKVVDAVDPLVVALEREVRGRRRQAPHLGGWGGG